MTSTTRPEGFDAFWDRIDAELAALPAAPEAEAVPLHSTASSDTSLVKLTGIGPYRFNVFLSIPHGEGPFPALMLIPGYGSVVTPPSYDDRQRYVAMSVRHRGTRGADKPYAATYPGLLTDGIADPETWAFRGIVADLIRAFEYLAGLDVVDTSRILVNGGDPGLVVAARRPGAKAIAAAGAFFTRLAEHYPRTEAYPFEEINDHLRAEPGDRTAIDRTLAFFDPVHHVNRISADVFLSEGDTGAVGGPEWMAPLVANLGGPVTEYPITHEGQTDYDIVDAWLAGHGEVPARPRTWVTHDIGSWSAADGQERRW